MKKLFWLLLAIVIILGTLVLWLTTSNRRFNVSTGRLSQLTTQNRSFDTQPQTVHLVLRTAQLKIKSGNHYQLTARHVSSDQFKLTHSNGVLSITEANAKHHQLEIGKTPVLTLTVPTKVEQLTVDQLNGTLALNDLTVGMLTLHHHNGTTKATNLTVTRGGELIKQNGRTDLRRLTSDGLSIAIKTGQFKLNGIKRASNQQTYTQAGNHPLTIKSGTGQVRVTTN